MRLENVTIFMCQPFKVMSVGMRNRQRELTVLVIGEDTLAQTVREAG